MAINHGGDFGIDDGLDALRKLHRGFSIAQEPASTKLHLIVLFAAGNCPTYFRKNSDIRAGILERPVDLLGMVAA